MALNSDTDEIELLNIRRFSEKGGLDHQVSQSEDEEVPVHTGSPLMRNQGKRKIVTKKAPLGIFLLEYLGLFRFKTRKCYQIYIFTLTFLVYTAYHMSRKPISVVASILAPNCNQRNVVNASEGACTGGLTENSSLHNITEGWAPFDGDDCKSLIGAINYALLFSYAIFLIGSGLIADRVNLRYFLTIGMLGCGLLVGLMGVAYFAQIHTIVYFIFVQIGVGVFQSTGWPAVTAVMGNWFGKRNRGLVLGVWNAHTSLGNILGTVIPAIWADNSDSPWGWSFLVPAFVMVLVGVIVFLFLVTDPTHVGLTPPKHHLDEVTSSLDNGELGNGKKSDDENVILIKETKESNGKTLITPQKKKAVGLFTALKVPGVIEFSLALFFAKLVSYSFLFWLPYYVVNTRIGGECVSYETAALLATLFDIGGIVGSISTGVISDLLGARAISCVLMMYLAVPTLFLYRFTGSASLEYTIILILLNGLFINGPYALITTAVANDLGTHKVLTENQKAKATVSGIIDATGSIGAACGPLLTGVISDHFGWSNVFYIFMVSCFLSSLMLSRVLFNEIRSFYRRRRSLKCYLCWTKICRKLT